MTKAPSPPTTEVHTADTGTVPQVPPQCGLTPSSVTSWPRLLGGSTWIVSLLNNTSETVHQKSWPAWLAPITLHNLKVLGLRRTSCFPNLCLAWPAACNREASLYFSRSCASFKAQQTFLGDAPQKLSLHGDTSLLRRKRTLPPASPHVSLAASCTDLMFSVLVLSISQWTGSSLKAGTISPRFLYAANYAGYLAASSI